MPWTRSTTSSGPASSDTSPGAPTCRAEVASLRETAAALADDVAARPAARAAGRRARRHHAGSARCRPSCRRWPPPYGRRSGHPPEVVSRPGGGGRPRPRRRRRRSSGSRGSDDTSHHADRGRPRARRPGRATVHADAAQRRHGHLVRSAKEHRAVLVTEDMPRRAGRQGLPAVAADAGGRHGLGRADAGRADHRAARRATPTTRSAPASAVEPEGGSEQPTRGRRAVRLRGSLMARLVDAGSRSSAPASPG